MAGMTFDMYTSGENAGEVIRPLQYTTTEDDATRVKVYLQLATPFGKYVYDTDEGLDYDRILDPTTSDDERGALVRDVVLQDERVESVVFGPSVTVDYDADNGPEVTIKVTFRTITGTVIEIGT
jgi:hypothetical protein